jgi:hypothetical protein
VPDRASDLSRFDRPRSIRWAIALGECAHAATVPDAAGSREALRTSNEVIPRRGCQRVRGEYASVGFDDRFALCHLTRVDAGGRVSVTNQPHYVQLLFRHRNLGQDGAVTEVCV